MAQDKTMFPHTMTAQAQEDLNDGRTRLFTAKGGTMLPVPGLVKLERVRIGANAKEVPLKRTKFFPVQKKGKTPEQVPKEVDTVKLYTQAGVGSVLVRAIFCNDGIWQDGMDVYVTGDWEGDEVTSDDAPSVYDAMSVGDLQQLCKDRGIKTRARTKDKLIAKLKHHDAAPTE